MAEISFPILVRPANAKEKRPLLAGNCVISIMSDFVFFDQFECPLFGLNY